MTPEEQDRARAEQRKQSMEKPFDPVHRQGTIGVQPDTRIANAAEYSAYQLGQINQSLKAIVRLLGEKT